MQPFADQPDGWSRAAQQCRELGQQKFPLGCSGSTTYHVFSFLYLLPDSPFLNLEIVVSLALEGI